LSNPEDRNPVVIPVLLVVVILAYEWIVIGLVGPDRILGTVVTLFCFGLCLEYNRRYSPSLRDWGLDFHRFTYAMNAVIRVTLPALVVILGVGFVLGTLHTRAYSVWNLIFLFVWALVQQFALQTVVFRACRERFSRRLAPLAAAGVFAMLHLPNPFLVPLAFLGGFVWCWLYRRHANLIPLALSHGVCSFAILCSFSTHVTGAMRVGTSYFMR
jgi:membrane protease YdiL (CAAX protease family)